MSTSDSMKGISEANAVDPFDRTSYRLVRHLARGGMGQVYLVEHRELGRECVAKVIHERLAKNHQLLDRVRIEAESLGALRHPNIVSVNNFGTVSDGRPFIVMEYLRGRDLGRALGSGRTFSIWESIDLVLQVCSALSAAHSIGIVHRDIKPDNLFLHEEPDGSVTLKVLDFGLARVVPGACPNSPTPLAQPTSTGVIVGSMRYVSPEGALGKSVDCRADIYSLGLVLYRLVAGRGPFGDDLPATGQIVARLTEDPEPPSFFASTPIPLELDHVLLKALRRSPEDRYQNVKEFSEAIALASQYIPQKPLTSGPLGRTRTLTVKAILFVAAVFTTAILVAILVTTLRRKLGMP
jgi:eukaryotic-like serine/threonine-protein kinase